MSINSDFKKTNSSGASITMQHYIFAFVQDVINQPDNLEKSKNWLKEYCEKEKMDFFELNQQLNSFFQLLEAYRKTNTFILYRFLRLQAQACFIDKERFELLRIDPAKTESLAKVLNADTCYSDKSQVSSSHNSGIVGGHIIGL
jgi:hypothetical protein